MNDLDLIRHFRAVKASNPPVSLKRKAELADSLDMDRINSVLDYHCARMSYKTNVVYNTPFGVRRRYARLRRRHNARNAVLLLLAASRFDKQSAFGRCCPDVARLLAQRVWLDCHHPDWDWV